MQMREVVLGAKSEASALPGKNRMWNDSGLEGEGNEGAYHVFYL